MTCAACGAPATRARVRWRKDGHDVLQCGACGLLFRRDLPDHGELVATYGEDYFSSAAGETGGQGYSDYLGAEPVHRANASARLDALERHVARGRLLDVGCAAGFFLDEARRRGWSVEGVELAPSMASYALDELRLPVHVGTFDAVELEPGSFDAVTMWDYIEHSVDPAGDLRRAAALLRPGGVVALSTGDAGSFVARVSGRRWHLLTPRHHNFFFSRPTLRRILASAGLEVLSERHEGARYTLAYLVYKLRTMADVAPLRRLAGSLAARPLGERSVGVNLHDIVTVVARRP